MNDTPRTEARRRLRRVCARALGGLGVVGFVYACAHVARPMLVLPLTHPTPLIPEARSVDPGAASRNDPLGMDSRKPADLIPELDLDLGGQCADYCPLTGDSADDSLSVASAVSQSSAPADTGGRALVPPCLRLPRESRTDNRVNKTAERYPDGSACSPGKER